MYAHDCLAYQQIEITLREMGDGLNIYIHSKRTNSTMTVTLSIKQASVLALGLVEQLTALPNLPTDDLVIQGEATLLKEAA